MIMYPSRVCIQIIGAQYVLLNPLEIVFFEADRQVCHLMLSDGAKLTAARHLGYYKQGLIREFRFLEISKSQLVNLHHVTKFNTRERILTVTTGHQLSVAKSQKEDVARIFKDLHDGWQPREDTFDADHSYQVKDI